MKHNYIILAIACLFFSCNDWLNVKPESETEAKEMFKTAEGFKDALTSCYIKLNQTDLYGKRLTMTDIEYLAQHWDLDPINYENEVGFKNFNYSEDYGKSTLQIIYGGLYNTIVQANTVLENMPAQGSVIRDEDLRAVIEAEALAIRAFCHTDILRLFGQLPRNATVTIDLPYAENITLGAIPYYNFDNFVSRIFRDLDAAEALFKKHDPVLKYNFAELDDFTKLHLTDDFLGYRRFRFNYYAVLALKARLYLYLGNLPKAYEYAQQVIRATDQTGNPLLNLAGDNDFNKSNFALPSECILALSNFEIGQNIRQLFTSSNLYISRSHFSNDLFAGTSPGNNRALNLWTSGESRTLKKYTQPASTADYNSNVLATQKQIIPLLRLSEMYLIAIESATSLTEANNLYSEYMLARSVTATTLTETEIAPMLLQEYRREFFAEGQMFYTYKRLGAKRMMWKSDREVSEKDYLPPLPASEIKTINEER